jgi:hypothetical protein
MTRNSRLFALIGAVMLVVSVLAPAVSAEAATAAAAGNTGLGVDVTQEGDGVTVSVIKNDTGVEGANVTVEPVGENATYEDAGNYTTDDEGVVELSAPEENVTVAVTAAYENETANTTVALVNETFVEENETDAFGQEVAAYIKALLSGNETAIGPMVSDFVTGNNPGADNRPDHAGPPEDRDDYADDGDANETDGDEQGPPEDAGPPEDRDDDADDGEDSDRGPPEDAGPPEDRDDDADDDEAESAAAETEEDDADDEAENDEEDGDGDDNSGNGNGR